MTGNVCAVEPELLMVNIGYSAPGVDMTAQGVIGGREFRLESDGSAIRSRVEVKGVLGRQLFALAGRTKNLRDRDFSVQGSWDGTRLELNLVAKGRSYVVEGSVGEDPIAYSIRRSVPSGLLIEADGLVGLGFRSQFEPVLQGKTEQFRPAGIIAAFLPCLLRSLHGSIDGI